jgi:hypothetical protein
MIEKLHPYETPIMRKLGTVKDLTLNSGESNGYQVMDPISAEFAFF